LETIKPLHNRIFVKREIENDKTSGGIYIADNAKKKLNFGTVVSVGEGTTLSNGEVRKIPVNVGDKICFTLYAGTDIDMDGVKHVMIKEDELFGVIED
jgi:chaperonin GroES